MKWTVVGFWGGHPEMGEATSAYLIEEDGFRLLVDCGSGVLAQLPKYTPISELNAVILSHYHHDHIADIGVLQYAKHVEKYIGTPTGTLPIYGHQLEPDKFAALTYEDATVGVPYHLDEALKIGPFHIEFLPTVHPAPCAAMRFTSGGSTIVFTGDTSYIPELVPFSEDADLLVSECSLYKETDGGGIGHMNTLDVGRLASEAKVKSCLLTHLPHYGNHDNLIKEASSVYKGHLALAKSGWIWDSGK
ncbi:MAG: MBL fold metallo-hydrolase [Tuberibacillus sp.]